MSDAPERIGLIPDGFGRWALATKDEADIAVHYIRASTVQAQIDAAVAAERERWVNAIEHYFDATAVMDVEQYVDRFRKGDQP